MKLYSYFRSSAAFRVRIALNLKGLDYDTIPVHLLRSGGEQHGESYRALNPEKLVPTLIDDGADNDGQAALAQSLAIIEYLEETQPQPPLLPSSAVDRAHVRGLALAIACDIHPLNNLRVLRYLSRELKLEEAARNDWYRHWCMQGLTALEARLSGDHRTGQFCYGDAPSLADCCLVPQIFNARRVDCDLSGMPTVLRIFDACMRLEAFERATPAQQPDAE
ncbi:maleylacetoacetate isomerase [Noviherbaspirillum pedocola]|uniref:Maleylacetoacetate isomerase n=1 Tax=Noviherbaspirillum pedocola TaxID=2801341 RepID=A0A934SXA9_9BURK|nr:maleylacetoacetate isomerase [Noviherbaspirillum pedocola]MBK4737467.1 maleylacetoacetate isomerase [Noviherbaspirillum pedocola]